jgi:4-hydroxy 2-oxovalerate aldolase
MTVKFLDTSLRDGSHALGHTLTPSNVAVVCNALDRTGMSVIEVGHGNGIGASSWQVGFSLHSDEDLLIAARKNIINAKLGAHVMPGISTYERDIKKALKIGVDYFRVACHCTEANITKVFMEKIREENKIVWGSLMMSHMATSDELVEQAKMMQSYGANGVIIYDSAGNYGPNEVSKRIKKMKDALDIEVGFHGHNNLGLAIANAFSAIDSGATMIDGAINGFGAGAGNLSHTLFSAACKVENLSYGLDLDEVLNATTVFENVVSDTIPIPKEIHVISGLYGVFSGFVKPVQKVAEYYEVDPKELFKECGRNMLVAGQEDLIVDLAFKLKEKN